MLEVPSLYPIKNINISTYLKGKYYDEWCAEKVSSNNTLLITIGDSWTWGDGLGKIYPNYNNDDKENRYKYFYTNVLADKLSSDWLNISRCGVHNRWMIEEYKRICKALDNGFYNSYKKVYVHICFTELFRDLSPIDHKNQDEKLYYALLKNVKSSKIHNFSSLVETYFQLTIEQPLLKFSKNRTLHTFSKNFWNINYNLSHLNFIDKPWQEVLFNNSGTFDIKHVPVVSQLGIKPLLNFLKENNLKNLENEFKEITKKILKVIDYMMNCDYNRKKYTKHPTIKGHNLWANYLYENFRRQKILN